MNTTTTPNPDPTATAETIDRMRATYPGCVWFETNEGLIVVRRPTSEEVIRLEDVVGSLTDVGAKLNPYLGLDDVKALVVYPSSERTEELLQNYPELFDQLVSYIRHAACRGAWPKIQLAELTNDELFMRETTPNDQGIYPKRCGGRIFAVEHYEVDATGDKPIKRTIGRYLFRRFALIEHREFLKEVAASGFLDGNGNRSPRHATFAKIARAHAIASPTTMIPNWEEHPYLLILLGRAVKDESQLKVHRAGGK